MIALVLKGLTSLEDDQDIHLLISLSMLHHMHEVLPLIMHGYNAMLFQAVTSLGFFGLFRPGELTDSPHIIHMENVMKSNQAIVIKMPTSKFHRADEPQLLRLWPQPYTVCPVDNLY